MTLLRFVMVLPGCPGVLVVAAVVAMAVVDGKYAFEHKRFLHPKAGIYAH